MNMVDYLIYRRGSNAANQPSEFGWIPVSSVTAANREAAVAAALADGVTCYANQKLIAKPASQCSRADYFAAVEADESRRLDAEALKGGEA